MPRKTFPRRDDHHRVVATEVLQRHAQATGRPVELPVPIDLIAESTLGLELLWDELDEPPGAMILGALFPAEKRIVLNERHQGMFERWIGPERFTIAHEVAHWLYDADDPNQLSLALEAGSSQKFCYHRDSPGLTDDTRIRELNANKLASHLLLPEHLVRAVDVDAVLGDFRETAARWGVSQQALRIRLETLGLIDEGDITALQLM